jgi:transposase-like protein
MSPVPKAFPEEFRRDVIAVARKGGASVRQVAKDFGISEACLHRWLKIAEREDGGDPGGPQARDWSFRAALLSRPVTVGCNGSHDIPVVVEHFRAIVPKTSQKATARGGDVAGVEKCTSGAWARECLKESLQSHLKGSTENLTLMNGSA